MLWIFLACTSTTDGGKRPEDTGPATPAGSPADAAGALLGRTRWAGVGSTLAWGETAAEGGAGLFVGTAIETVLAPVPSTTAFLPDVKLSALALLGARVADLDGDGWEDVFVAGTSADDCCDEHWVEVYRGPFTGTGYPEPSFAVFGSSGDRDDPDTSGAITDDLDGDGLPDAVYSDVWSRGATEVRAVPPDFASEGVARVGGLDATVTWAVVPLGDADGDGVADLLVASEVAAPFWFGPLAEGSTADVAAGDLFGVVRGISGDLDGDGYDDLLAWTSDGTVVALAPREGIALHDSVFGTLTAAAPTGTWTADIADLDADGRDEVAVGTVTGGAVYLVSGPFSGLIDLDQGVRWYAEEDALFGASVLLAPDGRLYVGAPYWSAEQPNTGAVFWFER